MPAAGQSLEPIAKKDLSNAKSPIWHTGTVLLTSIGLGFVFNRSSDPLLSCVGFSVLAYVLTNALIPTLGPSFIKVGFYGRDLGKNNKPLIPETMGAVCGLVYMSLMFLFIPFLFYKYLVTETSGAGNRDQTIDTAVHMIHTGRQLSMFPHSKLAEYLAALLSLFSILVLGVADDLFDIRWRNKLFMPVLAVIPLMVVYYVDFGVTDVVVPQFVWSLLHSGTEYSPPPTVNLGIYYYAYMLAVAIFCPNSINILAGINGLEVGQAVVVSVFLLLNDAIYILRGRISGSVHPAAEAHLLSTYFVLPLLGVSIALLKYNWYPARVFVGDTYCYFAGMVFAEVGILGHFAKTLLVFLIPQVINFIYSAPQLFKLIECPRHRLPKLNVETGLLESSRVEFKIAPTGLRKNFLSVLAKIKLVDLETDRAGKIKSCSNLTIINLVLTWTGPLREDKLAIVLLAIQAASCGAGLIARHTIAPIIFGRDNI
ncbi:glycosyl transferase family 4-domain-containing protein [Lipomyces japonicus]|uniref:glycosyl transferase family 4-domain-containing protein n=1 Tax=Lipomyces japonicus TaxID=56871 RepID=UPI0034D000AA